jgi:hypothetical protein
MGWVEPASTFTGVALLLLIFLFTGYQIGRARREDLAAYDAQIDAEAPGAGDLTQELPEVHTGRLADAGDGQALTSGPAPGGASAAADTLTRSAAAPGGHDNTDFGRALRAALDPPELSTAAGRALLIGMRQADMSTELFRSPLVVITRYAGPDLGPGYSRGRVQITLGGHTDAGLPRQIGMSYAHWAQLAAAVETIGAEPDQAEAQNAD